MDITQTLRPDNILSRDRPYPRIVIVVLVLWLILALVLFGVTAWQWKEAYVKGEQLVNGRIELEQKLEVMHLERQQADHRAERLASALNSQKRLTESLQQRLD